MLGKLIIALAVIGFVPASAQALSCIATTCVSATVYATTNSLPSGTWYTYHSSGYVQGEGLVSGTVYVDHGNSVNCSSIIGQNSCSANTLDTTSYLGPNCHRGSMIGQSTIGGSVTDYDSADC